MHHTYSFPSRHLSRSFFLFLTVLAICILCSSLSQVIMMVSRHTICTSRLSLFIFLSYYRVCFVAIDYSTQPVCMLVIYSICILIVAYAYRLMHCITLSSAIAIE
ncbi:hypothetical protein BDF19DRAFT_433910 [Syncephalis fuscata]|nr:hypothetical protein BDF19DRAFT_433910 [Syncephalis fuscata]